MPPYTRKSINTALVGLILTLLAGLFARELTRSAATTLGYTRFAEASAFLALGHGHFLVLFTVIPLILALIVFMMQDTEPDSIKGLDTFTMLYHLGATLTLALMLYKGYALIYLTADLLDFNHAEEALFGSNVMVRAFLYTAAHPIMAIGLIGVAVKLLRAQKKAAVATGS